MASKKNDKTKSRVNTVKIVGYLKENNLEKIEGDNGSVIRGSVLISTGPTSSYKVQYYVSEYTKDGNPTKDYEGISKMLPENTVTIASILKERPEADFNTALEAATKVWTISRFDEYASRNGERVTSIITYKGFRIGVSKADSAFAPTAEFETEMYIEKISPEYDDEENTTGRIIVTGLVPKNPELVNKIDFIAPAEEGVAKYVETNYSEGDTVTLLGDLINYSERVVVDNGGEEEYFGKTKAPRYDTTFVRERLIKGGSKNPLKKPEDGAISKEEVKKWLANREIKMDENAERALKKAQSTPSEGKIPSTFTFSNSEEVDF